MPDFFKTYVMPLIPKNVKLDIPGTNYLYKALGVGNSFDKIAKEIKVSKPTLLKWDKEF